MSKLNIKKLNSTISVGQVEFTSNIEFLPVTTLDVDKNVVHVWVDYHKIPARIYSGATVSLMKGSFRQRFKKTAFPYSSKKLLGVGSDLLCFLGVYAAG